MGQIPLNDAFIYYHHPGFLELGGGFRFRLGGDSAPYVQLQGGVNGWANFDPRRFNLEGSQDICFGIPTPPRSTTSSCARACSDSCRAAAPSHA